MFPQPNGWRGMQWVEQSCIGENINFIQKSLNPLPVIRLRQPPVAVNIT